MNTPPQNDDLLAVTLDEAARRLQLCRRTLEREIAAGRLTNVAKIGRSRRIPLTALADWLKSMCQPPKQA